MFRTHHFSNADDEFKAIDVSLDCLVFVLRQLFHPQMICADPGGTCSRIEDTIRFITRNLDREEQLMAAAGYPALAAHKREHEKLLQKLERMKRTLVCGNYDNTDVFDFVMDWTKRHAAAFHSQRNREVGVRP